MRVVLDEVVTLGKITQALIDTGRLKLKPEDFGPGNINVELAPPDSLRFRIEKEET